MVGENIKKIRINKNWTQQSLADNIGKSIESIKKYEKGSINPPIDVLIKIAIAFDTSIYDLLGSDKKEIQEYNADKLTWQELPTETQEHNSTIGDKIKIARQKNNITKSELARNIGVSPSYITMLENGEKTNPSYKIMIDINKVLNTNVFDINSPTQIIKDITLFTTDELLAEIKRRIEL